MCYKLELNLSYAKMDSEVQEYSHLYPGCYQCTYLSSVPRGMIGTAGGIQCSGAIWAGHSGDHMNIHTTLRNPSTYAILEVRAYLEEPLFHRSADPLRWWQTKVSVYPHITCVIPQELHCSDISPLRESAPKQERQLVKDETESTPQSWSIVFLNRNLG